MSEKIVLKNRTTRDIVLPESKVTVTFFASLLAKDLQGISFSESDKSVENGIKILSRIIHSWNIFASEKDEKPTIVSEETIGNLPAEDITFLLQEVEQFAKAEKKN